MPKQLLIIRHAKSDWDNPNLNDFERNLNKRGKINAPEMAIRMLNKQIIPQLIVSSPAKRAITTANYFAEKWAIPFDEIVQEKAIYEANIHTLLEIITQFNDQFDQIALFGHNPGLTDLTNYLTGGNIYNMPTCSIAILNFDLESWAEISADLGKVVLFDYPKSIND